jgi:ATP dependent DNA ligase domain
MLHEIKHDGFRVIARKDGPRVRLYSRPGNDLTHRFPLILALLHHRWRSSRDDNGVASSFATAAMMTARSCTPLT